MSKPLQAFLDYVDGNKPGDELMREIDNEVAVAKNREEWRREYMTMEMEMIRRERAAVNEINRLNQILIKEKRFADLEKATTDTEYQSQLMRELLPR